MKGVIFNAVELAVEHAFGADAWDDVLDRAGVEGAYTSLGNYDDAALAAIIEALPDEVGSGTDQRLRWAGIGAVPFLVESFPHTFEDIDLRGFLPSLNHMIHPEVRKLYPGANPPDFDIEVLGNKVVNLGYRSERKLCWLAEGFIYGVSAHLKESVSISQTQCMHRNDDHCDLRIEFTTS